MGVHLNSTETADGKKSFVLVSCCVFFQYKLQGVDFSENEIIPMENQYQTRKLWSLMQRLVQIFVEVTVSLGNIVFEKERGGQYDTAMVALFMILFGAASV